MLYFEGVAFIDEIRAKGCIHKYCCPTDEQQYFMVFSKAILHSFVKFIFKNFKIYALANDF